MPQFWQNINKVRVAGAGISNYVIAKDDVGNWYVKRYAADPKPIIKSAQNLAMFGLSAKMKVDLLNQRGEGLEAAVERTKLDELFEKHQARYTERTKAAFDAVVGLLVKKKLQDDISIAWQKHPDVQPFRTELGAALATASVNLPWGV